MKNIYGVVLLLEPATSLEVTLLHGCFSRFLNCINGIKSRKASHIPLQGEHDNNQDFEHLQGLKIAVNAIQKSLLCFCHSLIHQYQRFI